MLPPIFSTNPLTTNDKSKFASQYLAYYFLSKPAAAIKLLNLSGG